MLKAPLVTASDELQPVGKESTMTKTPNGRSNLLKEAEVADFLNVSVLTLRRWRWQRRGPRFVKLGRAVRYRPEEVEDFVRCGTEKSGSEE
jgi:predicted DNA-binding transcriptional regulator AlpA